MTNKELQQCIQHELSELAHLLQSPAAQSLDCCSISVGDMVYFVSDTGRQRRAIVANIFPPMSRYDRHMLYLRSVGDVPEPGLPCYRGEDEVYRLPVGCAV